MDSTIKDVAKRAKVSPATVSLVLNNSPAISEQTRRKVLKAAKELDYHPRASARGLARKKSGNIGFILTEDHFSRAEPFYTKVFLGTEFEARDHEYYILLTTIKHTFNASNGDIPRFLLERNVDGIILAGKVPGSLLNYLEKIKLPVVMVDYWIPSKKISAVLIDNINGAREVVAHLAQKGHKNIAFLGGDLQHPSISERLQGFRQGLRECGCEINESLIVTDVPDTKIGDGEKAMSLLFDRDVNCTFTAIFACNDAMAIGALQTLRKADLRIPEDVAIVGFDDTEAAALVTPHLTTVYVDTVELGAIALRQISEMIEGGQKKSHKILIPTHLVIRESSGG